MSDGKKDEQKLPAIDPVTGGLNYTSPSAIAAFNPEEYGGCPRKWVMKYKFGFKEDETSNQAVGTKAHAQL